MDTLNFVLWKFLCGFGIFCCFLAYVLAIKCGLDHRIGPFEMFGSCMVATFAAVYLGFHWSDPLQ